MQRQPLLDIGKVAGAHGIKGWIKVVSYTEPADNIVKYKPWRLKTRHGVKEFEVGDYRHESRGLLVRLVGIDDRDRAAELNLAKIAVDRDQLPDLDRGEYYWHQLEGLRVLSEFEGRQTELGHVQRLLETGANDVLVVKKSDDPSSKEHLVPYVEGHYVKHVDLEQGVMMVDWDPDF